VLGGLDWFDLVLDDANLIPHDKLSYVQRMSIVLITILSAVPNMCLEQALLLCS